MRKVAHPPEASPLAYGQVGLLATYQCEQLGISSDRRTALVRHGVWRRVAHSVYDCGVRDPDLNPFDLSRLTAAWTGLLAAGPDGISTGMCALALHGVWGLPRELRPEAMLPGARANRGPAGVRIRRGPASVLIARPRGARAVDVATALVQALPEMGRNTAVAVMDSSLHLGALDLTELATVRRRLTGRRGCRRLLPWWELVDGRAESPLESHARLDCGDHGLPPDELQLELTDADGRFICRGDLAWRRSDGSWVIAELDGVDVHSEAEALFRDRARQNDIATWSDATLLRFTSRDVYRRGFVADRVRSALSSTVRFRG